MRQTPSSLGMLVRQYRAVLRHMAWMDAVLGHPIWCRILRHARTVVVAAAMGGVAASAAPTTTSLVVDGTKTGTTVATSGSTYTVTTTTVTGNNALNAFKQFDVANAATVNLVIPASAENLINVVRDTKASEIYGTVNALKNDKIGGHVYFLNPHGVMIGATGVINVGSLTIAAPTQGFVDGFFNDAGGNATKVLEGKVPLGNTGLITVEGRIHAMDLVSLAAKDVTVRGGRIYAGEVARVEYAKLTNVASLVPGTAFTVTNGAIRIVASSQGSTSAAATIAEASKLSADKTISVLAAATTQNDFNGNETAKVEVNGKSVLSSGGKLSLTALSSVGANLDASEEANLTEAEKAYLSSSGSGVVRMLEDMAIPLVNLHFQNAAASIKIDDATLTAAQELTLHSKAEFKTKLTVFGVVAGFAYGQGAATSDIDIKGTLQGGSIDVLSETNGNLSLSTKNTVHGAVLSDKVPFDAMVAVGITRYSNNIRIDSASKLTATTPDAAGKANLSVKASTVSTESLTATAGGEKEALAIAVGVGIRDASTSVTVGGTLAGAVVDVKAEFAGHDDINVSSFQGEGFFSPISKPIMGTAPVQAVKGFFGDLFTKIFKLKGGQGGFSKAMGSLKDNIGACGAVAYRQADTKTTVAVNKNITASESLAINAAATETELRRHVSVDVGKDKKIGLGVSVNIDNRNNVVDVLVGSNAVLEAGKSLTVHSEYTQPYRQTFTDKFTDLANATGFFDGAQTFFSDTLLGTLKSDFGLLGGFFTSGARSAAEGESFAAAASVNIGIGHNQATTRVADRATLKTTDAARGAIEVSSKVLLQAVNFSGDFGLPLATINPKSFDAGFWFHGTKSGNVGAGASYLGNFYSNDALTLIGDATLATKNLTVKAQNEGLAVNLVLAGGKAGSFGFDAAVGTNFYDNNTIAQLSDGATVNLTGKLDVSASDALTLVAPQGGICVGESVGFGISVGYTQVTRHTVATIGFLDEVSRTRAASVLGWYTPAWSLATGASATARTLAVPGGVSVKAENRGLLVNVALAGTVIKDADPSKAPKEPTPPQVTDLESPETPIEDPGSAIPVGEAVKSAKSSMGAGVSGDAVIGVFNDRADAVVRGSSNLNAGSGEVSLSAVNDDLLVSVAGALTVATKDTVAGIAGSFAFAKAVQNALASLETTGTTTAGKISVAAERKGLIVTAGASINAATKSQKVGVAASGAFNELSGTTQGSIKQGTVAAPNGAVDVKATDNSTVVAVTGALSAGRSNVGIGGTFSWNQTDNDTIALLENLKRLDAASLNLLANNNSAVYAISAAGAVAMNDTGFGLAGSFSVNRVLDDARARITAAGTSIINTGALSVQALDGADGTKSDVTLLANNPEVAAVYNAASTRVEGDTQGVSSGSGAEVKVESNPNRKAEEPKQIETYTLSHTANAAHSKIVAVNLGFGVGSKGGFALAGSYNEVRGGAATELSGGVQVTVTGGQAALKAISNGNLIAVGASAGAGGKVAGAASIGINIVDTATKVELLSGAKLVIDGGAARTLELLADNRSNLIAVDVAGAGAGTGAVAGTFAYNQFKGDSLVTLSGGSRIEAPARKADALLTVSLAAKNSGEIVAVGVGGAAAGKAAGAAALGVNRLGGDTVVTLDGAQISSSGNASDTLADRAQVTLSTENTRALRSVSVAGSAAGTAAGAAAFSYNQIGGRNAVVLKNATVDGSFYGTNTKALFVSVKDSMTGQAIVVGGSGAGTAALAASVAVNTIGNPAMAGDTSQRETQLSTALSASPGESFSEHVAGVEADHLTVTGSASFDVTGSSSWLSVSVAGAGAGTVAGGLAGSYNNIAGRQSVVLTNSRFATADVFGIRNSSGGQVISVAGGVAGAGTVAVGAAVLINNFNTQTSNLLDNVQVESSSDTTIAAENSSKIVAVSVGGAGAGTVAVGASGLVNRLANTVAVDLLHGTTIDSRRGGSRGSITVSASQKNHVVATAVAGGGAGVAAVAGAVGVNVNDSTVRIAVRDSRLQSSGNVAVRGTLDDSLLAIGVGASGAGIASVAGTVNANVIGLHNTVELTGATIEAAGGAGTGETADGHQGASIEATTREKVDVITINGGGAGIAAVQAAAGVNVAHSNTAVTVSDSSITSTNRDVVVRASDRSEVGNYAVSVAGAGVAGIGAGVGTDTFAQDASTTITNSTLLAKTGDLVVAAKREQIGRSVVVGAGGGIVGIGGSVGVGYYGGSSQVRVSGGTATAGRDALISSDGIVDITGVIGGASGGVVGLGMGIQVITVKGDTAVRLENAAITSGRDIGITAKDDIDVHATVACGSGGAVAVNGALNVLGLYDTVSVTGLSGSRLTAARDLALRATTDLFARDVVGGGAVGAAAFGIALDVLRAQSSAIVDFNGTASAGHDATFASSNVRDVESSVVSGTVGGVAVGGAASVAMIGPSLDPNAAPTIEGYSDSSRLVSEQGSKANTVLNDFTSTQLSKLGSDGAVSSSESSRITAAVGKSAGWAGEHNTTPSSRVAVNGTIHAGHELTLRGSGNTRFKVMPVMASGGVYSAGASIAYAERADLTVVDVAGNLDAAAISILAEDQANETLTLGSGAGGLVGVSAAYGRMADRSETRAHVADRAVLQTAGTLLLRASSTQQANTSAALVAAGAVGVGGAGISVDSSRQTNVEIGSGVRLAAHAIDVDATATFAHNSDANKTTANIVMPGVGLGAVTVTASVTNVANATGVTIRGGTTLESTGDLDVNAANVLQAYDFVQVVGGGAVAVVNANTLLKLALGTKVNLNGATLRSGGMLDVGANTTGTAWTKSIGSAGGAAGGAAAVADISGSVANSITAAASTVIESSGASAIVAGCDSTLADDALSLVAEGRSFAYGVVVIPATSASAKISQTNRIDLAAGSRVAAVGDVAVLAGRRGAQATAYYSAKWNGIGSDNQAMTLDDNGGYSGVTVDSKLVVGGTIDSGTRDQRCVYIDASGAVFYRDPDQAGSTSEAWKRIDCSIARGVTMSVAFDARIRQLQDDIARYAGDANAVAKYRADLALVQSLKAAYGNRTVDQITVAPVTMALHDVRLGAGAMSGDGRVNASGGSHIKIVNDSSAFLKVSGVSVDDSKGFVYFNGIPVSGVNGFSGAIKSVLNGNAPVVSVANRAASRALLQVTGDVVDPYGSILLNSAGTVFVDGAKLNGAMIAISAGGDFLQSYTPGFVHVGGQPAYGGSGGSVISGGSIFIAAEKLNLNGTLRSGVDTVSVTITSADAAAAAKLSGNSDQWIRDLKVDNLHVGALYYNPSLHSFKLSDIRLGGGHVELFGNILSTGSGRIEVFDGSGSIAVNNPTNYELRLAELDAGSVQGLVRITDTSKVHNGQYVTTEFLRTNGTVAQTSYVMEGANRKVISTSAVSAYQPTLNRRLHWVSAVVENKVDLHQEASKDSDTWVKPVESQVVTQQPITEGGYWIDENSSTSGTWSTAVASNLRDRINYGEQKVGGKTQRRWETHYTLTTYTDHTLKADNPIAVSFFGAKTGSVTVNSTGALALTDAVNGRGGIVNLTGSSLRGGASAAVTGGTVNLTANSGSIGSAAQPLIVEAADAVNAKAAQGGVAISSLMSDLKVDRITAQNAVILDSQRSVKGVGGHSASFSQTGSSGTLQLTRTPHIIASQVTLRANGAISGDAEGGLAVYNLNTAGRPAPMSLSAWSGDGAITLSVPTGTLAGVATVLDVNVDQILANNGNVTLAMPGARIFDGNGVLSLDPLTDEEVRRLWGDMGLTSVSAETRVEREQALVSSRTLEYHQTWALVGFDRAKYNSGYKFTYTDKERTALAAQGFDSKAIAAEEERRSRFYHSTIGAGGATYNAQYKYALTVAERTALATPKWDVAGLQNSAPMNAGAALGITAGHGMGVNELPNIAGRTVTITAADVGAPLGEISFAANTRWTSLTPEQQFAVRMAASGDITIKKVNGADTVVILKHDDFDLLAADGLVLNANSARVYSDASLIVREANVKGRSLITSYDDLIVGGGRLEGDISLYAWTDLYLYGGLSIGKGTIYIEGARDTWVYLPEGVAIPENIAAAVNAKAEQIINKLRQGVALGDMGFLLDNIVALAGLDYRMAAEKTPKTHIPANLLSTIKKPVISFKRPK